MQANDMIGDLLRLLAALTLVALLAAPAAAQGTQQRVPVEQATTEQKARFVENLVTRSVAARTIETSGDQAAKDKLARARALVGQVHEHLAGGRAVTANAKLDEALFLVKGEARRLSQDDVSEVRRKRDFDRRHNAANIFLAAFERVAEDKQARAGVSQRVIEIRALVNKAEVLAGSGRLDHANESLDKAYRLARGDIREMREGMTLTRSLNFETAAEEYRYEHDRNVSHIMLHALAVNKTNPPQTRMARIGRLREEALGLRDQAVAEATSGAYPAAIETIVHSTETLLKAIRVSGIWIPQ